jgi:hypothetical protein
MKKLILLTAICLLFSCRNYTEEKIEEKIEEKTFYVEVTYQNGDKDTISYIGITSRADVYFDSTGNIPLLKCNDGMGYGYKTLTCYVRSFKIIE